MTDEPIDQPEPTPARPQPPQPQPPQPPTPPTPADQAAADAKSTATSYLVIGVAFFVISISFITQESMRGVGFAFIAVAIAFLVLGGAFARKRDTKPDA